MEWDCNTVIIANRYLSKYMRMHILTNYVYVLVGFIIIFCFTSIQSTMDCIDTVTTNTRICYFFSIRLPSLCSFHINVLCLHRLFLRAITQSATFFPKFCCKYLLDLSLLYLGQCNPVSANRDEFFMSLVDYFVHQSLCSFSSRDNKRPTYSFS